VRYQSRCLALGILGLALLSCAREEAEAARTAAREYVAALATGRYGLLFDLTTEESRNFWEEISDGFRDPGRCVAFRPWGDLPARLFPDCAFPDAASVSAREIFVRRHERSPDRLAATAAREESPVVVVDVPYGMAGAWWIRSGLTAFLVWQRGAWRVEFLTTEYWPGIPARSTSPGPFGRPLVTLSDLIIAPPPLAVRLPRLWGMRQEEPDYSCRIYTDAAGAAAVKYARVADDEDLIERLFTCSERKRDEDDRLWHYSEVEAILEADRRLPWNKAFRVFLAIVHPSVRFRHLLVRTDPEIWSGFDGDSSRQLAGIPFELEMRILVMKVRLVDAGVELIVDPGDVAAGRLARLPAVWAAVPAERREHGVRLVLADDLTFEEALRVLVAVGALAPERIVLGARAEEGAGRRESTVPPLEVRLATAPFADAPAPLAPRWPIPLTIHYGRRPDR
jgi:hypothetical protein